MKNLQLIAFCGKTRLSLPIIAPHIWYWENQHAKGKPPDKTASETFKTLPFIGHIALRLRKHVAKAQSLAFDISIAHKKK